MEQEEDAMKEEINQLHLLLCEKEKESEQREEVHSQVTAHLRE